MIIKDRYESVDSSDRGNSLWFEREKKVVGELEVVCLHADSIVESNLL